MPRLQNAVSRTELIASHTYGRDAFASYPWDQCIQDQLDKGESQESAEKICGSIKAQNANAAAADAYASVVPPAPAAASPDEADAAVTDCIAAIKAAVDKAIEAQKADPDTDDPKDEKVMTGLTALSEQVAALVGDQAADAGEPEPAAKAPVTAAGTVPAQPVATKGGTTPDANPVDEQGNVDNGVICANPDCGHLASAHANTDQGDNTGACSMLNCSCEGMNVDSDPNNDADDDADGDGIADNSGVTPAADKLASSPVNAVPDAPVPPGPPAQDPQSTLNAPPEVPGGENMGPAFTIPVLIIEGQPTGDGRQIAPGALTWRTPPLPLMGLATETHDPEGFDQNDPAVLCGRIDSLTRADGEGGTQIISAQGFFLANDDGQYFADLVEGMGRVGVSGDVAANATEIEVGDVDEMGFPIEMSEKLTEGVVMGATIVPFPAFEGAYIVLGDGTEQPDAHAIPQTADSPTVPDKPPAAVTAGGQLVHLMTYEACEPCDQGLDVIAASGAGPVAPPKAWFEDPNFDPDDGRMVEIFDRRGRRVIGGKFACPLTITDEGRVFGHIAPWGVCHTGTSGQCILAPRSSTGYAHYRRGQHLVTAEGDTIRVGVITCDAGHAPIRGISASQAMAHYDNTAVAVADVNIGEDEHGIWVAGAMRPDVTESQVRKLRASSISGDWRQLGGSLELVAALAVNQPGFPIVPTQAVLAAGEQALVAVGTSVMDRLKHPPVAEVAEGDAVLRAALAPLLGDAKTRARDRLAVLRD
jgi:hypothetical protein